MKYATVMTTGLLVNLSLFASDMPETQRYDDLMDNKQRLIRQLSKQAECIRLADTEQELLACQDRSTLADKATARQKSAENNLKKTAPPSLNEFF